MKELTKKALVSQQLFDPVANFEKSCTQVGYLPRSESSQETYQELGFICGLEIHQQLLTDRKLFCNCPAGIYQSEADFTAEIIRHMRPTLSEMGEYDGTALMEKRTKKTIVYLIKNESACTYDIDDTPPFKINKEALKIALGISLQLKTSIVGELHIARKQYLDGSIPAGFQRTGILGIEGEIYPGGRKIRIIQISIEEDSCREVSDIGHTRIYRTDRLGMPLIETVTYPDMHTPDEVADTAEYIRLLNRSSGKVRTGIGAARQDVNVSINGGTRVEIKGVAHIKWIPKLTHNECFRQKSLLEICIILNKRVVNPSNWEINYKIIDKQVIERTNPKLLDSLPATFKFMAVNLPRFEGILSFFTQPGNVFADEISDRLKVIACIERPNLIHSEMLENRIDNKTLSEIRNKLNSNRGDAQLIIWGEDEDIPTALETIKERCLLAFEGVPQETRKAIKNGNSIFERVLPGPNRMYPDTDTAPISIDDSELDKLRHEIPGDISTDIKLMGEMKIPKDCHRFLLRYNLVPLIDQIVKDTGWSSKVIGVLFGQTFRAVTRKFNGDMSKYIRRFMELCKFIHKKKLNYEVIKILLPAVCNNIERPLQEHFDEYNLPELLPEDLKSEISSLLDKFEKVAKIKSTSNTRSWVMGQLRNSVIGQMMLAELAVIVDKEYQDA